MEFLLIFGYVIVALGIFGLGALIGYMHGEAVRGRQCEILNNVKYSELLNSVIPVAGEDRHTTALRQLKEINHGE